MNLIKHIKKMHEAIAGLVGLLDDPSPENRKKNIRLVVGALLMVRPPDPSLLLEAGEHVIGAAYRVREQNVPLAGFLLGARGERRENLDERREGEESRRGKCATGEGHRPGTRTVSRTVRARRAPRCEGHS